MLERIRLVLDPFFLFGRAGAAAQRTQSNIPPPRRRAFRSNGCQASHFRCNPSRMLVGPFTRFAANSVLPRLNIHPRRDFIPRNAFSRSCRTHTSHCNL
ncbi:MAG: hypothetical protein J5730_04490 [Bacteroidales bacterium]|nr:hypothetical protein [Bacteroidales bacterium]